MSLLSFQVIVLAIKVPASFVGSRPSCVASYMLGTALLELLDSSIRNCSI